MGLFELLYFYREPVSYFTFNLYSKVLRVNMEMLNYINVMWKINTILHISLKYTERNLGEKMLKIGGEIIILDGNAKTK